MLLIIDLLQPMWHLDKFLFDLHLEICWPVHWTTIGMHRFVQSQFLRPVLNLPSAAVTSAERETTYCVPFFICGCCSFPSYNTLAFKLLLLLVTLKSWKVVILCCNCSCCFLQYSQRTIPTDCTLYTDNSCRTQIDPPFCCSFWNRDYWLTDWAPCWPGWWTVI